MSTEGVVVRLSGPLVRGHGCYPVRIVFTSRLCRLLVYFPAVDLGDGGCGQGGP